jgi:hypothetical protein
MCPATGCASDFEDTEDNVIHTEVGEVHALDAKATQLRAVSRSIR